MGKVEWEVCKGGVLSAASVSSSYHLSIPSDYYCNYISTLILYELCTRKHVFFSYASSICKTKQIRNVNVAIVVAVYQSQAEEAFRQEDLQIQAEACP